MLHNHSLLSYIAGNFIKEYENVANSSISYLLNKYALVREVLQDILDVSYMPQHFVTELATKNNGRLDITWLNENGEKVIIIEWKFRANLTKNQPVNYLKELIDTGKILFLVPEKRKMSLEYEIYKRIKDDNMKQKINIISWNNFLEKIEQRNKDNEHLTSDIWQLKELCEKMDKEWMPPLSYNDLESNHWRVCYQFSDIIEQCKEVLKSDTHINFKWLQRTSTKYWYGFYFNIDTYNYFLMFSSYEWYQKNLLPPSGLKYITIDERNQCK